MVSVDSLCSKTQGDRTARENAEKVMSRVKILKKSFTNQLNLPSSLKRVPYHGGFGALTNDRVVKVACLQFIGSGFNPASNLKLSKFHENFYISQFWPQKHFAIIF